MSILLLRSFVEVYRQNSVSKAAAELGLTQPAVSGHIASLEALVERKLFTRHARGMRPTVIADELALRVSAALDIAENALAEAKARSHLLAGALHFCGPSDILSDLIVAEVQVLVQNNLTVHLHPTQSDEEVVAMLTEGRADFGFALSDLNDARIEGAVIGREELLLVAAPRLASEIGRSKNLAAALENAPFVAYDRQRGLIREWMAFNKLSIARAEETITAPDLRALRNFVVKGAGWSVLPRYLVVGEVESGALKTIARSREPITTEYRMLWLKSAMRNTRTAYAKKLIMESR